LNGYQAPRQIRQITQIRLYMWCTNPEPSDLFPGGNMGDHHLQRLVQLAQSRWPDTWWTIGRWLPITALIPTPSITASARHAPAARWATGDQAQRRPQAAPLAGKGYSARNGRRPLTATSMRAHASGLNDSEIGYRMKWTHQQSFTAARS